MTTKNKKVPYANKGIGSKPYEKKKRRRKSRANPHPTIEQVLGSSYREEANLDHDMGLEAFNKWLDSRLTVHLRKAGLLFKMAADRYDESERLLGNTLEKYIKEDEE